MKKSSANVKLDCVLFSRVRSICLLKKFGKHGKGKFKITRCRIILTFEVKLMTVLAKESIKKAVFSHFSNIQTSEMTLVTVVVCGRVLISESPHTIFQWFCKSEAPPQNTDGAVCAFAVKPQIVPHK